MASYMRQRGKWFSLLSIGAALLTLAGIAAWTWALETPTAIAAGTEARSAPRELLPQTGEGAEITSCDTIGGLSVTKPMSLKATVRNASSEEMDLFVRFTVIDENRQRSAMTRSGTQKVAASETVDTFTVQDFSLGEVDNVEFFPGQLKLECALFDDKIRFEILTLDLGGLFQTWSQDWLVSLPQDKQLYSIEIERTVEEKKEPDEPHKSVVLEECSVSDVVVLGESPEIEGHVNFGGWAKANNYRLELWAYPNGMAEYNDGSGKSAVHVGGGGYKVSGNYVRISRVHSEYIPKITGRYTAECLLFGGNFVHQEAGDPGARQALRIMGLLLEAKSALTLTPSIFHFVDTPIDLANPKTLREIEEEEDTGTLKGFRTKEFSVVPAAWGKDVIVLAPSNVLDHTAGEVTAQVRIREGKDIDIPAPTIRISRLNNGTRTAVACGVDADQATGIEERCWQASFEIPANRSENNAVSYSVSASIAGTLAGTAPVATLTVRAKPQDAADIITLGTLYDKTNGTRWIHRDNWGAEWLETTPFDDWAPWHGVTIAGSVRNFSGTAEDGNRVVGLELSDNNLTGEFPVDVGGLTELRTLDFASNSLRGRIPAQLGNLNNLESLDLSFNSLSGPIPVDLAKLSNLQEISLAGNGFSGAIPSGMGSLAQLISLDLSDNELSGTIPASLGSLSNLEFLDLSENRLEGEIPATLGNLTNLTALYLDGGDNDLTGCIPSKLRDLRNSDLDDLGLPFCDVALSSLDVAPGQLDDPFDYTETRFSATVHHSRITVTPIAVEGATFQFRRSDNSVVSDADPSEIGHQMDLTPDDRYIRVRAISQDGESHEDYTINLDLEAGDPGVPNILSATPTGASLAVSWVAPAYVLPADISSYNLRHIRFHATDKSDDRWTVIQGAGEGGAVLREYQVDDLTPRTAFDVQVQAVLSDGPGPWSSTVTATTGEALRIWRLGCYPRRTVVDRTVRCWPRVFGGVLSDYSYSWRAEGSSTPTGTGRTLESFWGSAGSKKVTLEVCSAGLCQQGEGQIVVEGFTPRYTSRFVKPPSEIALGDSLELEFGITKKSVAGQSGGVSVSFPDLTDGSASRDSSLYDSVQGTVETAGYTGGLEKVAYYDSGASLGPENRNGSRSRPQHLLVATNNNVWPLAFFFPPTRTLKLKVTPKQPGEFRVVYRFWLCEGDQQYCVQRPLEDEESATAVDPQGWPAFEYTVNVVHLPVIESLNCNPVPVQAGQTVLCNPVLDGGSPASYAWNAGNALAGGSTFESSGETFSTDWSYDGRHRITLEVCNIAGCDSGEQVIAVGTGEMEATPETWTLDDGARILYSGPASDVSAEGYSPTDTTLEVKILPTSPLPTLEITILDADGFADNAGPYTSPGALTLALPEDAWVDYGAITRELLLSGDWTPFTENTQQVLLALERVLSAARRTTATVAGIVPSVSDSPLTAADRLAWALGEEDGLPLDDIFEERHANCVSQVTIPWLAWAEETKGVRVSLPLSLQPDAYFSLAASFTAAQPGAANDGKEPALPQLHDLLTTSEHAPGCESPESSSE